MSDSKGEKVIKEEFVDIAKSLKETVREIVDIMSLELQEKSGRLSRLEQLLFVQQQLTIQANDRISSLEKENRQLRREKSQKEKRVTSK